jgi:hypothetical protein
MKERLYYVSFEVLVGKDTVTYFYLENGTTVSPTAKIT